MAGIKGVILGISDDGQVEVIKENLPGLTGVASQSCCLFQQRVAATFPPTSISIPPVLALQPATLVSPQY